LLKQKDGQPLSVAQQTISFFALNDGMFKNFEVKEVGNIEKELHTFVQSNNKELFNTINTGKWSDEISANLKKEITNFLESR
jgi:F-type H+-transporting ATPase subunit alpha